MGVESCILSTYTVSRIIITLPLLNVVVHACKSSKLMQEGLNFKATRATTQFVISLSYIETYCLKGNKSNTLLRYLYTGLYSTKSSLKSHDNTVKFSYPYVL